MGAAPRLNLIEKPLLGLSLVVVVLGQGSFDIVREPGWVVAFEVWLAPGKEVIRRPVLVFALELRHYFLAPLVTIDDDPSPTAILWLQVSKEEQPPIVLEGRLYLGYPTSRYRPDAGKVWDEPGDK